MNYPSHHRFHIPVMGIAFTIDTPIKVARFGISSVISIVEDRLIEMMRKYYYEKLGQTYIPIPNSELDYRANRITDYLNLVNKVVKDQIELLKNSAFEKGSEIIKYFEMLPDDSTLKQLYQQMVSSVDESERIKLEKYLRSQIRSGSIDVNIMTKLDKNNYNDNKELLEDGSDAIAALRGYANSDLDNSAVVFSAGMNPRLYNYLETTNAFNFTKTGGFKKRIIIKVSDYRSALIQGKYLAKKGLWVSEFRIESGLNCGGHAFATDGYLLGPILEEFKSNKIDLVNTLFEIYSNALKAKNTFVPVSPPEMAITVQGGIGTSEENLLLHQYYQVNSTGWGTPFLLVPEATTVDAETLDLLCKAKEKDVELSHNSPLGVRFHYLKGASAEIEKEQRINDHKPGSPCTEKHLAFNTEFTEEPICTASKKYQKLKLAHLRKMNLPDEVLQREIELVHTKECLCVGLSNSAAIKYDSTFVKNQKKVSICPGPNIVNFSQIVSLQTMVDHIYGRTDITDNNDRPHFFIKELNLYISYLKEQLLQESKSDLFEKRKKYFNSFISNLRNGINYYQVLILKNIQLIQSFEKDLYLAENELNELSSQFALSESAIQIEN